MGNENPWILTADRTPNENGEYQMTLKDQSGNYQVWFGYYDKELGNWSILTVTEWNKEPALLACREPFAWKSKDFPYIPNLEGNNADVD